MLLNDDARCQGARPLRFCSSPIQQTSLPADCIDCERRKTVPGVSHSYMEPPTWGPWEHCPSRVLADVEEVC
jgi:hypothetical protein